MDLWHFQAVDVRLLLFFHVDLITMTINLWHCSGNTGTFQRCPNSFYPSVFASIWLASVNKQQIVLSRIPSMPSAAGNRKSTGSKMVGINSYILYIRYKEKSCLFKAHPSPPNNHRRQHKQLILTTSKHSQFWRSSLKLVYIFFTILPLSST